MSTTEDDAGYDVYLHDMHEGYMDCLEGLSKATSLSELAEKLQELEDYANNFPELNDRKSKSTALRDQALSFDTVIRLARNSLSKRRFFASLAGAFLLGLAVNYAYDLLKSRLWF